MCCLVKASIADQRLREQTTLPPAQQTRKVTEDGIAGKSLDMSLLAMSKAKFPNVLWPNDSASGEPETTVIGGIDKEYDHWGAT